MSAKSAKTVNGLRYYRADAGRIVGLGAASLVSAVFQAVSMVLLVPLAQGVAKGTHEVDKTVGPIHLSVSTGRLAVYAAVAIVGAAILDFWIAWARAKTVAVWERSRREQVIREYLSADYATQSTERLDTLSTLTGYATRGAMGLGAIVNGLEAFLTLVIFVGGSVLLDYRAALLLFATFATLSFGLRPVMVRTKRYSRSLSAVVIEYGHEVTEATRMSRDVRIFHASGPFADRLTAMTKKLGKLRQRSVFMQGLTSPAYQYGGMLVVVVALAAAQGIKGLDITILGAIALLLLRSMSYGQQLQNSYQNFIDCMPYVDALEAIRATYTSHPTSDGSVGLEAVHTLALDHVHYSYDDQGEAVSDVTAQFNVGEIVGIVGPSGSGKSTISQLILRLREPTKGSIRVNGTPAGDYTLASWYRHVSLVPQDTRLLHATVAENIAFLDPTISREQVVVAARAEYLHDVIEGLQHGYDTLIGPAFRDLSGGQIQRIGIARALVRGAEVLVLDEPTSALDVHSETVIQATLESLRGRVLALIIAHRFSTLSICDRVMVLRDGKVETIGSLPDVSANSDFFQRALDAGTLEVDSALGAGDTGADLEQR